MQSKQYIYIYIYTWKCYIWCTVHKLSSNIHKTGLPDNELFYSYRALLLTTAKTVKISVTFNIIIIMIKIESDYSNTATTLAVTFV